MCNHFVTPSLLSSGGPVEANPPTFLAELPFSGPDTVNTLAMPTFEFGTTEFAFTDVSWHEVPINDFAIHAFPKAQKFEFSGFAGEGEKKRRSNFKSAAVVGIDGEYVQKKKGDTKVTLLSLQYCVIHNNKECSGIMMIKNDKRPRFDAFMREVIEAALTEGVLDGWPTELIVCAHFLRADLMHFSQAFSDFEGKLRAVRNTMVSMEETYGMGVDLTKYEKEKARKIKGETANKESKIITQDTHKIYDSNRNYHSINIKFYDTMTITPTGQSLSAAGEILGVKKVIIPSPYSIKRMDEFLAGDQKAFTEYSIIDAVITARFFVTFRDFCQEVGLGGLPYTIGGVALNLYKKTMGVDLPKLFGQEVIKKEIHNEETGKFRTIKGLVSIDDKIASESFVTNTYHGGVNNCHQIGPTTEGAWYDYDAQSCYTTIANGIRSLDYEYVDLSRDINDYLKDVMGFAQVEFEFPSNTRYPSLPIRTDKYGLVYPLKGISWCTSHELVVAHNMGAKIRIKQGYVIPWADDNQYVFRAFMQKVRAKRKEYKATGNVFYEKLWKEIGNSLYGKTAQGLRNNKTGFDIFLQYSKKLPPSAITNAYYASYTTGLARALMFELMVSISDNYEVASVTTDGFLTNAPMNEIDLNGPISSLFRDFFRAMNGDTDEEILEEKHRVKQLISMKTRGQLTSIPIDQNPVLARAGVQVKFDDNHTSLGSLKLDQNAYMLDLYLNREPGQKHTRKSLVSQREMFTHQTDMVSVESEQRLNLEPDFKRNLCNPTMRTVNGIPHLHLETKPFETIEDMLFARVRFDAWRKNNCLKTLEDWYSWQEFYLMSIALSHVTMRLKEGEHSGHLLLRLFLRAYGQAKLGLRGDEYTRKALVAKFTDWGYSYKTSDFTPAKKATLYLGVVPRTKHSSELASLLTNLLPNFAVGLLFMD